MRRILELCLLAYPVEVRERDGEELLGLALELAEAGGTAREAAGLLRGGMAERRLRSGPGRRALVGSGAVAVVMTVSLGWAATAAQARVEVDTLTCTGECAETRDQVAERIRDGWTCAVEREPARVTWQCARD